MKLAYGIVAAIFENKERIIQDKKQLQLMSIKERLVKYNVEEQYERHYENPMLEEKP